MLNYKNEYINLVILGNFNPSILTHDFLVKECGLKFEKEPIENTPRIPVVASLEYDNINFLADLGRFQITEKECTDPVNSNVPLYLKTYLDKLPFTPISKCGANFSYVIEINEQKLRYLNDILSTDRNKIIEMLKIKEASIDIGFIFEDKHEKINNFTIRTKVKENKATTLMKIQYQEVSNTIKTDFNYEISGLEKDKELIKIITEKYPEVYKLFKKQIELLFS